MNYKKSIKLFLLYFILYYLLIQLINFPIPFIYKLLSIESNFDNRYLKLLLFPLIDLITFVTLFSIYKKYNLRGYFFRHLFLVALSIPLFVDFVTLTDYIASGFDFDKLCNVHYMDKENFVWFFPLNLSVLIISIILFVKTKTLHNKNSLRLLGIYILFYMLFRYSFPFLVAFLISNKFI